MKRYVRSLEETRNGSARFFSIVACACALLLAPFAAFANQDASRDFSREERASLERGGLVQRPLVQRRGALELMGGTSYQVIDAAPDVVWRALLDTNRYPRMMPQVREARLVKSTGSERTVFVRQGAGPVDKTYYLKVKVYEAQRNITFTIDDKRPHDLRAAWGFYTVRPYAGGKKTLLAYGVMADIGRGMVVALVRDEVHDWMLKVPWTVKRFVEGSGRKLYRSPSVVPPVAAVAARG